MKITLKLRITYRTVLVAVLFLFQVLPDSAPCQIRIKDIARVKGLEERVLTGLGIVTGLRGTGDGTQATFTQQEISNILRNYGVNIDPTEFRTRNTATVTVTAKIPPFAKRGNTVDVIIASIGDARSLEGGVLVYATLSDEVGGQVLAFAQGPITIGGLNVRGAGRENYPVTGNVINGATILQDIETSFTSDVGTSAVGTSAAGVTWILNQPDFTTASRIAQSINDEFGENTAEAVDPATINVKIVGKAGQKDININYVNFIAAVEQLTFEADVSAAVVINERTGTVVVGNDVKLSPVLISHGDLTIEIRPPVGAPAQPPGQAAQEGSVAYFDKNAGSSVADLAAALNALGVTPRDLSSIFQALKANGSLKATLKIM